MEVSERQNPIYNPQNDKFSLNKVVKNYANQFNQLYNLRLAKLRGLVKDQVKKSWGNEIKILDKIIDSEIIIGGDVSSDFEYVMIGTIYKQMDSRNSVLDEFKDSNSLSVGLSLRSPENYSSESDYILLEDESGRITLSGSIKNITHDIVTGVVVAVRGKEKSLGSFESSDWLFLNGKDYMNFNDDDCVRKFQNECLKNSTYEAPEKLLDGDPLFVMIVSDLQISGCSSESDLDISRQIMFDFVSGRLGSKIDKAVAGRICRLVVAGSSLSHSSESQSKDSKYSKQHLPLETAESLNYFDLLISQSLGSVYIDIMPGLTDPSNLSLPQQPLNSCLFPQGSRFNSLNLVTNPHAFDIDGYTIVGHSGQPVNDILRQTRSYRGISPNEMNITDDHEQKQEIALNSINALRKTHIWGHYAPTAPDTLACHPFTVDDPFIVEPSHLPKIVFSGCQKYFATKVEIVNGKTTRLLSIPSFNLTKQAVLVDIKSLNYQVMSF